MFLGLRSLVSRMRTFVGRRRVEARLRDELELHAELVAADLLRRGASPEEARRQARLAVGGLDQLREDYRDALGFRPIDDLARDLRLAFRGLRRSPAFSAVAVVTLTLGIGVNAMVFNAVYALLWRPLPFPAPERLVAMSRQSSTGLVLLQSSGYDAAWLRDHVPAVEEIGLAANQAPVGVLLESGPVDLESTRVNAGYLRLLGLRPVAGRLFGDEEDRGTSDEAVALLTEAAWRRYFRADPSLVGRTVTSLAGLTRRPIRIVGVLPDCGTLPYAAGAEIFTPIPWQQLDVRNDRGTAQFMTVFRLKAGATLQQASNAVTAAMIAADADLPQRHRAGRAWLVPLREALLAGGRTPIWLLYGAAGLLLILTTANVASLFLARAVARQHETAVRMALGASVRHAVRAEFAEALLVSLAGLGAALALNRLAQPLVAEMLPELRAVGPELLRVGQALVAFGVVSCVAISGSLAVLPAVLRWRTPPLAALSTSPRVGPARTRWREMLVTVQLAVILVLLAIGGLVGRSFVEALRTDPGFDPAGVITFAASLPAAPDARIAAAYEMADVVASLPGTKRVGFSLESPLRFALAAKHSVRGEVEAADPTIPFRLTSSGYLETLGARLVRGRLLEEADVRASRPVTVLNESAARLLFGTTDPVGRTVRSAMGNAELTVVGVVRDMRTSGLDRAADPTLYRPYLPYFGSGVVVSVRTSESLDRFVSVLGGRLRAWNPAVVPRGAALLDEGMRRTIQPRLRATFLVGAFAILGLVIGSVGLYGTFSADVNRLARELGIRLALGAPPRSVLGQVLRRGARVVVTGGVVGLAGSAAAAVLIRRHLYGIEPWDGASFAVAVALLAAAASIAVLVPALRAARIDPAVTLREG